MCFHRVSLPRNGRLRATSLGRWDAEDGSGCGLVCSNDVRRHLASRLCWPRDDLAVSSDCHAIGLTVRRLRLRLAGQAPTMQRSDT